MSIEHVKILKTKIPCTGKTEQSITVYTIKRHQNIK